MELILAGGLGPQDLEPAGLLTTTRGPPTTWHHTTGTSASPAALGLRLRLSAHPAAASSQHVSRGTGFASGVCVVQTIRPASPHLEGRRRLHRVSVPRKHHLLFQLASVQLHILEPPAAFRNLTHPESLPIPKTALQAALAASC